MMVCSTTLFLVGLNKDWILLTFFVFTYMYILCSRKSVHYKPLFFDIMDSLSFICSTRDTDEVLYRTSFKDPKLSPYFPENRLRVSTSRSPIRSFRFRRTQTSRPMSSQYSVCVSWPLDVSGEVRSRPILTYVLSDSGLFLDRIRNLPFRVLECVRTFIKHKRGCSYPFGMLSFSVVQPFDDGYPVEPEKSIYLEITLCWSE